MSNPIRILGIAGSLRRGSYNRAALRAATKLVPEGAILETFELDGIRFYRTSWSGLDESVPCHLSPE
jgi:chromate reductase, NAD(P)H dehydrogenase (quinone)